jgi:hypothetical protein
LNSGGLENCGEFKSMISTESLRDFTGEELQFDLPEASDSFVILTHRLLPVLRQLKTHLRARPKIRRLAVFCLQRDFSDEELQAIKMNEFGGHPAVSLAFVRSDQRESFHHLEKLFEIERIDFLKPTQFMFLFHPQSEPSQPEIVLQKDLENLFRMTLLKQSQQDIDFSSNSEDVFQGLVNSLKNIKVLMQSPDPRGLRGIAQSSPALILGAGGSLEEHLPFLRENQDKAIIIAPDTLAGRLIQHGIHVDFYSSIERVSAVQRFFENWKQNPDQARLVGTSCLSPSVFELFSNEKVVSFVSDDVHSRLPLRRAMLNSGHSCVGQSMSLASLMGCSEAYLVGVDLCYSDQNFSHSPISPYYEKNFSDVLQTIKEKESAIVFESDYVGRLVKSDPYWLTFRNEFEEIARSSKTNFFNVSNKGLRIEGVAHQAPSMVESKLRYLKPKPKMSQSQYEYERDQEARSDLKKLREFVCMAQKQSFETLGKCLELQKIQLTSEGLTKDFFEALFRNAWAVIDFKTDQKIDASAETDALQAQLEEFVSVCEIVREDLSWLERSSSRLF